MTIGQFAKDNRLRYVKQLIIRSDNPGLQTHSMKHYLFLTVLHSVGK